MDEKDKKVGRPESIDHAALILMPRLISVLPYRVAYTTPQGDPIDLRVPTLEAAQYQQKILKSEGIESTIWINLDQCDHAEIKDPDLVKRLRPRLDPPPDTS